MAVTPSHHFPETPARFFQRPPLPSRDFPNIYGDTPARTFGRYFNGAKALEAMRYLSRVPFPFPLFMASVSVSKQPQFPSEFPSSRPPLALLSPFFARYTLVTRSLHAAHLFIDTADTASVRSFRFRSRLRSSLPTGTSSCRESQCRGEIRRSRNLCRSTTASIATTTTARRTLEGTPSSTALSPCSTKFPIFRRRLFRPAEKLFIS